MATVSKKAYYQVSAALMVLLGLTVAVHFLPLGAYGLPAALAIALTKALLIVLVFMHVRFSSRLTQLFAAAGVLWILILFLLTFADYLTRG